ncbi:porin family protein [Olleya sp. ITB9]|uniref:porin family protein n=1 Tax=Olleya sp. ITB9 TaxID=1715648 RepID=UPI0006D1B3CD|nr:porin family protein [Olleya sp. ITB9]
MKYCLLFCLTLFVTPMVFAQETIAYKSVVDSLYREDQFYLGVTYNLLNNKPLGVSQNSFSSGIHFGIIRDMPINARRNKAIGVGLGVSLNAYNHNLLISKTNNSTTFSVLDNDDTDYSKNKFYTYVIELPIEFRWRTSTPTEYDFWRIYTGFKLGYQFANDTKYKGSPEDFRLNNVDAFNELQYGLTLSAGYITWNFHLYYGLNTLFDDAKINNENLDVSEIKIGIMFYIL